jgi:hypothetical protein
MKPCTLIAFFWFWNAKITPQKSPHNDYVGEVDKYGFEMDCK